MHLYRHARVPCACLPSAVAAAPTDPRAIEPWTECDILIDGPLIVGVRSATGSVGLAAPPDTAQTDLGGRIVWPGLIDAHTHLDKTHTWDRAPNPRGEFWDAIEILRHDATARWTTADVYRRAEFGLRSAWAHGTNAVRTHLDSGGELGAESHEVMAQLRTEWQGRIALQTVSLCNVAAFSAGEADRVMKLTRDGGASAIGGFPQPNPDLPAQLDYLLAAARELELGVDLHIDESGLAQAECLRATAEAVLRNEFPYPVTCGHNCSLSLHEDARAASTIDLIKQAGIQLIVLPLCNLYLQGRQWDEQGHPRTPQWRGLTRIHELMQVGLTVACASDNVRDAFFAWGDYDLFEVWQAGVRVGHLDTRMHAAAATVTTAPATIMGLPQYGRVTPGSPADLVVSPAATFNEFLARPAAPRRLIHGESFRESEPPDYRELAAH
ncbi:cytosine deaminase [Opitutaceae bacterium LMO-CP1]|uniref:Cytosine deaminase n=2 Tax=Synoicihabitans lomoniglobus TaxID=2909285 RepID=A0AAF0CRB2_9BACT|nr:cytosine deaminase [Opitutaceae bacterium LMO-M01]WED66607.1 cytosine deaminase [Opitutaceae bacterium LMO-M01]